MWPAPASGITGPRLSGHVPGLDGVRGLAILLVMAVHFVGDATPEGPIERLAVKLGNYGALGVDLFFVLSGFLITGLLLDAKGQTSYFRNFYARRTLRIFPLYYLVLTLLFLVAPHLVALPEGLEDARRHQGWLWSYTANFYLAAKGTWALTYVSHFWSLAVEEHFYLVWPLVVFCLGPRSLGRVCLAIVGGALLLRTGLSLAGVNEIALLVLTPCRVDALAVGALMALVARQEDGLDRLLRAARPALWVVGFAILVVSLWGASTGIGLAVLHPVRGTLFAVFFGALTLMSVHPGRSLLTQAFNGRLLRMFGKYSYGLYVYHGVLAYYMTDLQVEARLSTILGDHSAGMVAQAVVGVGLSLAIAALSYEQFEKRFLGLKRYFETARRAPAAPGREVIATTVLAHATGRATGDGAREQFGHHVGEPEPSMRIE